jgi:2-oxoglutarate ferredoxin oxidoreductase subunit alpha
MNQWMTQPFEYPATPINRGKLLWEEDLERMSGQWGRYLDVDNDGIPYRTVPGNRHHAAAYFTRGTGHDEYARYSEAPEVWESVMKRLQKKIETAKSMLPKPVVKSTPGAEVGFLAFGSTDQAIEEAIHLLVQSGHKIDYMRLRALPSAPEVGEFIRSHKRTYVIELNRDGQLQQILTIEFPELATKMVSLAHLDGLPLSARWVMDAYLAKENE